jgi:CHASE3 domain sensor protein
VLTLFAFAAALIVGLVAASSWHNSVADSKTEDAQAFTARATLLEEAGAEGQAAATLLQTYVEQGDQTLLPQIQEHTNNGVDKLTTALAQDGASDITTLAASAAGLVDGSGQVVALRQSGDIAAAAAALQQLSGEFETLTETQNAAIQTERDAAASALSDANSADDVAGYLGLAAIVTGAVTGIAVLFVLGRTVFRRRVPGTASSM